MRNYTITLVVIAMVIIAAFLYFDPACACDDAKPAAVKTTPTPLVCPTATLDRCSIQLN